MTAITAAGLVLVVVLLAVALGLRPGAVNSADATGPEVKFSKTDLPALPTVSTAGSHHAKLKARLSRAHRRQHAGINKKLMAAVKKNPYIFGKRAFGKIANHSGYKMPLFVRLNKCLGVDGTTKKCNSWNPTGDLISMRPTALEQDDLFGAILDSVKADILTPRMIYVQGGMQGNLTFESSAGNGFPTKLTMTRLSLKTLRFRFIDDTATTVLLISVNLNEALCNGYSILGQHVWEQDIGPIWVEGISIRLDDDAGATPTVGTANVQTGATTFAAYTKLEENSLSGCGDTSVVEGSAADKYRDHLGLDTSMRSSAQSTWVWAWTGRHETDLPLLNIHGAPSDPGKAYGNAEPYGTGTGTALPATGFKMAPGITRDGFLRLATVRLRSDHPDDTASTADNDLPLRVCGGRRKNAQATTTGTSDGSGGANDSNRQATPATSTLPPPITYCHVPGGDPNTGADQVPTLASSTANKDLQVVTISADTFIKELSGELLVGSIGAGARAFCPDPPYVPEPYYINVIPTRYNQSSECPARDPKPAGGNYTLPGPAPATDTDKV